LLFGLHFFFRDPENCDGIKERTHFTCRRKKVMLIQEIEENVFEIKSKNDCNIPFSFERSRQQDPLSGGVDHLKYIEGGYVAAFNHKSSEKMNAQK
jgi:hypothetical protein